MMKGTTLTARLKDGTRVLCGRANCGGDLAKLVRGWSGMMVLRGDTGDPTREGFGDVFGPDPSDQDSYFLVFAPGWLPDAAGIWTLTQGARRRYERDRRAAYGGAHLDPQEAEQTRRRLSEGRSTRFRRGISGAFAAGRREPPQAEHWAILVPGRSVFARCPACTGVNRLEHDLLPEAAAWIPPDDG